MISNIRICVLTILGLIGLFIYFINYKFLLNLKLNSTLDLISKIELEKDPFPFNSKFLRDLKFKDHKLKIFHIEDFRDNDHKHFDEEYYCNSKNILFDLNFSNPFLIATDFDYFFKCIKNNVKYYDLYKLGIDRHKLKGLPQKFWHTFAGSSIWLKEYKLNYYVTRTYMVSNNIFFSLIYVQAFDENWNELINYNLTVKYEVYDFIRKKPILRSRNIKFPYIMEIPISIKKKDIMANFFGAEDPRIVLRKNSFGYDEPLVVFNMFDLNDHKRLLYIHLPFSKTTTKLNLDSKNYRHAEKNWTPFINSYDLKSLDTIHFVYSLDPLIIVLCKIYTGQCEYVQKESNPKVIGPLRGGTQFQELPVYQFMLDNNLKINGINNGTKYYFAMGRSHISQCGNFETIYRPNVLILLEKYNKKDNSYSYQIKAASGYFDFDMQLKLVLNSKRKIRKSIMIPNGISYWGIMSVKYRNQLYNIHNYDLLKKIDLIHYSDLEFNDIMIVTLSLHDENTLRIYIKNFLNNIIKMIDRELFTDIVIDKNLITVDCALNECFNYCEKFII